VTGAGRCTYIGALPVGQGAMGVQVAQGKKPKTSTGGDQNRPPPPCSRGTSARGVASVPWGVTPNPYVSQKNDYLCCELIKIYDMKIKLTSGNSVYGSGLSVQNGRLINNAVDGQIGIAQISNARREVKRQQKIEMQAEAILRADDIKEMREMMGGCCD